MGVENFSVIFPMLFQLKKCSGLIMETKQELNLKPELNVCEINGSSVSDIGTAED
jgi:hypothetical protein